MEIGLAVGGAFLSSALNKHKHDVRLLKKLRMTLLGLQAVVSDAQNKQASNPYVSQWLNEIQDAVDSAENLIEEVNFEALRLKVEGQHQNFANTISNQREKLEDTIETLEELQKQIGFLDLTKYLDSGKQEKRTISTSVVDESDIFGRQNEIEELIDRLLSEDANGKNLSVVPVVGMGGVGKTTLAKAVYNDEKVKDHFGLKAWICVSEPYDAVRITKELLQEISSSDCTVNSNLNQLQIKLKESLKGKKFLIVLDDVWNENYDGWDDLRNIFVQGDIGSKIIVTTRKESVALMMGCGAVNVGTLSSEVSWALFKRHSLENRGPEEHPELEEVGKQIAHKCKGLPLALKALAGILRSKSDLNEWRDILRSEIWELPSHSKDASNNRESSKWNSEEFLMHDLVNDLAQIASSNLCIRLEENQGSHMLEQSRHISYSTGEGDFEKLKPLFKSEQLRTLLPISIQRDYLFKLSKRVLHNVLPRLTSLRALSSSPYKIVELPNDLFIKLKLLRFLDISRTKIKKLPDSICVLYNLEILLLSSCDDLEELPLQMEKLINLHYLDISNTSRLKMPLHLSKLKSLHVLVGAKFLLGGRGGSRMDDLGEVHNLFGSLSILELQNVVDRWEALKANMKEKNHVEMLSLEWSRSIADNSKNEKDILDGLQPNTNINELQIGGYRGTKFPNWLADQSFLKLVQLSLSNCKDCDSLPALGQLPSLKFLAIRRMRRIIEVTEEFYGSLSSKKPFNSLEKLEFAEMPEWKRWHVLGNGEFPALKILSVEDCPKLIEKFPENLSSLTGLRISKCPELSLETPIQLSTLKIFEVISSPKVGVLFDDTEMFTSQLQEMKHIVELFFTDCNSLTSLPISILPSTLKRIHIYQCEKLKLKMPVGEMITNNMFLEELKLDGCDSIDDISPELVPRVGTLIVGRCHSLTRLLIPTETKSLTIWSCENLEILSVACGARMTSLRFLNIENCEKLKWLPECMQELLPSLNTLELFNCPEMMSFPEGGLPFNLQVLLIWNCKKLVNGRKNWRLQRLPCLRELRIEHDGSDEEILAGENWELPCSIQRLYISNLKTLSSQVLKSLTSLAYLDTYYLPQIQSLLEEGLPSSLYELRLDDHHEFLSLPTECLRHLTSLQRLEIRHCNQLQSLSESTLPPSLSELTIGYCPNLQSLPVKGMPSSLSKLHIYNCPLLKPLLECDKGEYWQKIAHISTIEIDWKYL
ncbi:hypothetical protein KY290_009417 [Solanum tuberosum]|uniref:Uncharacterized protein n=1 Tax=Solanum tuberosum TaxID=4113 RepID=A0ABQ7WCK9_SOLTU|nr:hypothetical protein KY290_009417 [Solanum tuberosum]